MRIGSPDDLLWLLKDIEIGKRTGCVKAVCQAKLSRAAVILYRGRAVGCVYGNKELTDSPTVEDALKNMLSDCKTPDTSLVMYGLPDGVVLALSAMFLGYTVERTDDLDARSYMDYMLSWLQEKRMTACFAFITPQTAATVLAYVYEGNFVGAYCVETQDYSADKKMVYDFLSEDPATRAEVSVLPMEFSSGDMTIGFRLT